MSKIIRQAVVNAFSKKEAATLTFKQQVNGSVLVSHSHDADTILRVRPVKSEREADTLRNAMNVAIKTTMFVVERLMPGGKSAGVLSVGKTEKAAFAVAVNQVWA